MTDTRMEELQSEVDNYGGEVTIKIVVEPGAGGTEFMAETLRAIELDREVYIQVAGEYGHMRVTALRDFEVN